MYEHLYYYANNDRLVDLLIAHKYGNISAREKEELDKMLLEEEAQDVLVMFNVLDEEVTLSAEEEQQAIDSMQLHIEWNDGGIRRVRLHEETVAATITPLIAAGRTGWWLAAAIAGIVLMTTIYIRTNSSTRAFVKTPEQAVMPVKGDAPDISKGAVLTLANGKQIVLSGTAEGVVTNQGDTAVVQRGNHVLSFRHHRIDGGLTAWNTIQTPLGKQYIIELPDSTRVWLNAASTLRFPLAFTGNRREVEMTGEAFFEVCSRARLPFSVLTGKQKVEVLGTSFAISSSAANEVVKTTLLQGRVQVMHGGRRKVLQTSGEQAEVAEGNTAIITRVVDVTPILAWKDDVFQFEETSIEHVMEELKRWYGVEVEFKNRKTIHFNGRIKRSNTLPAVLQTLEKTGAVKFDLQDKRVVVLSI